MKIKKNKISDQDFFKRMQEINKQESERLSKPRVWNELELRDLIEEMIEDRLRKIII